MSVIRYRVQLLFLALREGCYEMKTTTRTGDDYVRTIPHELGRRLTFEWASVSLSEETTVIVWAAVKTDKGGDALPLS